MSEKASKEALPCSLVLQLGFLNSALRQMDALEIIPPYQASIVIIGLAWGMVFTGDADGMFEQCRAFYQYFYTICWFHFNITKLVFW